MVDIATWEDDPGGPGEGRQTFKTAAPDIAGLPLPVQIDGPAIPPDVYERGTEEFRYWVAAEAVARGVSFWAPLLPAGQSWSVTGGGSLLVAVDEGVDLNAYYDRVGLRFFHYPADNPVVFSGESPEVVCHELGHAVLDLIKPELWDASFIEAAAFHEAFGDMSAVLTVLQADGYRIAIASSVAALNHYSRLSRAAEQLGAGLRQIRPDSVDPECLRCLSNSWFYIQPADLPPLAPAWLLSSEPHSFSRVFSGAFLDVFSRMVGKPSSAKVAAAAQDLGQLLVTGVIAAPVVPSFFAEVAMGMLHADAEAFQGKYFQALAGSFVRRGILAVTSQGKVVRPVGAPSLGVVAVGGGETHAVIAGDDLGLSRDLHVPVPTEQRTAGTAASALDFGPAQPPTGSYAGRAFVEDLFRRDRVSMGEDVRAVGLGLGQPAATAAARPSKYTHRVAEEDGTLALRRLLFDCCGR